MKLMRTLFQTALLATMLVVFSHPLRADSSNLPSTDSASVPTAPVSKTGPAHHLMASILSSVESGFLGDIVPMVAFLFFVRAMMLAISPAPRFKAEPIETEPPVEIPPPRQLPQRITLF
jgi:hypothetical protein